MEMSLRDTSRVHAIIMTCVVAPIIASLFVLLRVWTRFFVSRLIGWDDCLLPLVFGDSTDEKFRHGDGHFSKINVAMSRVVQELVDVFG